MATNIIVTGKTGSPHISAGDDGALHASMFGTGDYILNIGSKFAFEKADANHISVEDGLIVMQGRYSRLVSTEFVEFESGTIGYNRKDTLVFEYSIVEGFESVELVMVKGIPTEGTPEAPTLQQDDILSGTAAIRQVPLCHIEFTGTTSGDPIPDPYLKVIESPYTTKEEADEAIEAMEADILEFKTTISEDVSAFEENVTEEITEMQTLISQYKKITVSTSPPTQSQGEIGQLWIVY